MSGTGYEMIAFDEEYEALADQFQAFGAHLSETLEQYDQAIVRITNQAIPSGAVHDALLLYREYTTQMKICAENIGEKFARLTRQMLSAIDDIDDYLYSPGQGFPRDYSQEMYDHLLKNLDHPICSITDGLGDWLYGGFLKLVDLFHKDDLKKELDRSYRLVLDYNNETKAGLTRMFSSEENVNYHYGHSIAGATPGDGDYYTSTFDAVSLTMYGLRDMLDEMADIINPANGRFTVESIQRRMEPLFTKMQEYFEAAMGIPEPGTPPTIEQITEFAQEFYASRFFTDFNAPMTEFVGELGGTDAALMTIFNMFDIAETKLIYGDYELYTIKKQLLSVLKELGEIRELYADGPGEEAIEDCKTLLKYYKKYGKKFYDFLNTHRQANGKLILDGRTIEARHYREFLESLGNAGTILSEGEKGIEYLALIMADYEKSLEILDSYQTNFSGDEKTAQAAQELSELFQKKFSAYLQESANLFKSVGYDLAVSSLAKASPVMATVTAIGAGIDLVGSVTGVGTRSKRTLDALTCISLSTTSESAYRSALEKFQKADPSADNYEQLAEDVRNCFDLHKKNLVEAYSAMADASTGTKHSYYKYCEQLARSASMQTGAPDVMSYEEYLKRYN